MSRPRRRFPVTVTRMPVVRCQRCRRTVAYRSGTASEALTEHYPRVSALADEARAAREDAEAARHLAAASDRDVAGVRDDLRGFRQATTASFNAMRADLTGLQDEVRAGFTEMRGRLDGAAAGIEQITGLLNTLIAGQGGQPGAQS